MADSKKSSKKTSLTKWQRWRKRLLRVFLIIGGLYGLSLAVLNTSWFKSKITTKLEQRSGSEWQTGMVLWVPLGDVFVYDVQSPMGAGMVKIDRIKVSPMWGKLAQGKLVWNNLEMDGVLLDVDRQWILQRAKKTGEVDTIPSKPMLKPKPPTKPNPKPKPPNPKPKPPAPHPKPTIGKPIPKPEQQTVLSPERWVHAKNVNVRIRDGANVNLELTGGDLSVPFSGKEAEGFIQFPSVQKEGKSKKIPILWNEKEIVIEDKKLEILGLKLSVKSMVNIQAPGKRFSFKIDIEPQKYSYDYNRPNLHLRLAAKHVAGKLVAQGNLLSPQTWVGRGGVVAEYLSVEETQKTHKKLEFDFARMDGHMMSGNISIDNAAAHTHGLSIMANGVILRNMYAYGVVRCIVNDDYEAKFHKVYHGSFALHLDHHRHYIVEDLGSSDRKYLDLFIDGKLNDLYVRHNRSDRWESLKSVLKKLQKFKNSELKEDSLFEMETKVEQ